MRHPQQQAGLNPQEARFSELTTRILHRQPLTLDQVWETGELAGILAVIQPAESPKGKLICFPTRPEPEAEADALAALSQILVELKADNP